jgi:uncharacterized protein DUF2442
MKSARLGKNTSAVEVTNISRHGFWLLLDGRELFIPFKDFPWFKEVPVGKLLNVVLPHAHHLYWPDLDVDLAVESIEHPKRFPLVSKVQPKAALKLAARRNGLRRVRPKTRRR